MAELIDFKLYIAAGSSQNDNALAELVRLLGSRGIRNEEIMSYKVSSRNTLLHIASVKGNQLVVSRILGLLGVHRPISDTNSKGETALHLAARSGCTDVVRALLEGMRSRRDNTMLTAKDERGNTAAHEAVLNGHHQTVQLLMDYHSGVPSYSKNEVLTILNLEGESPLYIVVKEGKDVKFVESMLDRLDPAVKDKLMEAGKPLLYPAIMAKNKGMLDTILNNASELIRMRDGQGRMAIHYAASSGYDYGVDSLIRKDNSCVMQRDDEGVSPVHIAARNGQIKVLKKLLEELNKLLEELNKLLDNCQYMEELVTNKGRNILHEAADYGKHDVVKHILNSPLLSSLVNQQDNEGNTPLHLATKKCKPKIVSLMTWDARVDLKIVNDAGQTVVDVAEDNFNENQTKFQTRLTWSALVSAGGTKARDVKPKGPKPYNRIRGETSLSNDKYKPFNNVESEEQEVRQGSDSQVMKGYKERANTLTLVATLIATITFAAGFTVPGGYDQTTGVPIFMHRTMFSVFIICNSVALYSSIMVVVALIWAQLEDFNLVSSALTLALPLLVVALTMMSVAFMAGTYVFASPHGSIKFSWRGILVLVMGWIFVVLLLLLILPLCLSLEFKNPILRRITNYPFRLLVWLASDRHSIEDWDAGLIFIPKLGNIVFA
ncbi:hypothetical protein Droror1_Dr00011219 [Drosera rotundifolia]